MAAARCEIGFAVKAGACPRSMDTGLIEWLVLRLRGGCEALDMAVARCEKGFAVNEGVFLRSVDTSLIEWPL